MLVDTLILAFWVVVAWGFNHYLVVPLGTFVGLDGLILKALQVISGVPVVIQAFLFMITDLSGSLQSTVEAIRDQWKK